MYLWILLFSVSVFADGMNRLYSEAGSASSFLQSNWNKYQENYHPNYAFDDNPATAWVEGAEGNGENETLEWEVSTLDTADEVEVAVYNGYQKSKNLLAANGSVKEVELHFFGTKPQFQTTMKDALENKMGPQKITVKLPENHGLTKIQLKIISTYPGKTYKDTCISDIKTFVKSRIPYNPGVEQEKFAKLKAWIKERVAVAEFFAKKPAAYPFAHNSFRTLEKVSYYPEDQRAYFKDIPGVVFYKGKPVFQKQELLEEGQKLLKYSASLKEKTGWQKLTVKTPVVQFLPDGIQDYKLDNKIMKFFTPDLLAFFEVKDAVAEHTSGKRYDSPFSETTSHYRVFKENGELRAVSYVENRKGVERGPYDYNDVRIMAYDKGLLRWFIQTSNDEGEIKTYFHFGYDSNNKVNVVTKLTQSNGDYEFPPLEFEVYAPVQKTLVKK